MLLNSLAIKKAENLTLYLEFKSNFRNSVEQILKNKSYLSIVQLAEVLLSSLLSLLFHSILFIIFLFLIFRMNQIQHNFNQT
jgi:hypothetical protein